MPFPGVGDNTEEQMTSATLVFQQSNFSFKAILILAKCSEHIKENSTWNKAPDLH